MFVGFANLIFSDERRDEPREFGRGKSSSQPVLDQFPSLSLSAHPKPCINSPPSCQSHVMSWASRRDATPSCRPRLGTALAWPKKEKKKKPPPSIHEVRCRRSVGGANAALGRGAAYHAVCPGLPSASRSRLAVPRKFFWRPPAALSTPGYHPPTSQLALLDSTPHPPPPPPPIKLNSLNHQASRHGFGAPGLVRAPGLGRRGMPPIRRCRA